MRRAAAVFVAAGLIAFCTLATAAGQGPQPVQGFWQTPTIVGAGRIHALPNAAYQPDPNATYKIVFWLTNPVAKPGEINSSLEHLARAVNLYVNAGVPLNHLKFVAIASGPATPIMLDNAHYQQKYDVDNPNLPVIEQLRKAGIDVAVCGQAWAEHDYKAGWLDSHVTLALSALTTITELENQGYALMPL